MKIKKSIIFKNDLFAYFYHKITTINFKNKNYLKKLFLCINKKKILIELRI